MDIDLLINDKMKKNIKKKQDNYSNINFVDEREELLNIISDKLKNYNANIISKEKEKDIALQEKELDELIDNFLGIAIKLIILKKNLY